jgi:transcription termination/antitermination protein NusG
VSYKWYVIYVAAGSERIVKEKIEEKAEKLGITSAFKEILIPSIPNTEPKKRTRASSEKKVMPGYVFLHAEMSDKVWHAVSDLPKVVGFLGGAKPSALQASEIEQILEEVTKQSHTQSARPRFEPGEVVKILDGPFESFKGKVDHFDEKENKLVVIVSIFGNDTTITLESDRVKKA